MYDIATEIIAAGFYIQMFSQTWGFAPSGY